MLAALNILTSINFALFLNFMLIVASTRYLEKNVAKAHQALRKNTALSRLSTPFLLSARKTFSMEFP